MKPQVVFRNDDSIDPRWQYYGVNINVVGGRDSLPSARACARDAVDFLLESRNSEVQEHLEWRVTADTPDSDGIYVRARFDQDPNRWIARSNLADTIKGMLRGQPELAATFSSDLLTDMGYTVAIVALPDDTVASVVDSIGPFDTAYIGMPAHHRINWMAVSGSGAELRDTATPLSNYCTSPDTTVFELMTQVGVLDPADVRELTAV